jgi:hypothetical protein
MAAKNTKKNKELGYFSKSFIDGSKVIEAIAFPAVYLTGFLMGIGRAALITMNDLSLNTPKGLFSRIFFEIARPVIEAVCSSVAIICFFIGALPNTFLAAVGFVNKTNAETLDNHLNKVFGNAGIKRLERHLERKEIPKEKIKEIIKEIKHLKTPSDIQLKIKEIIGKGAPIPKNPLSKIKEIIGKGAPIPKNPLYFSNYSKGGVYRAFTGSDGKRIDFEDNENSYENQPLNFIQPLLGNIVGFVMAFTVEPFIYLYNKVSDARTNDSTVRTNETPLTTSTLQQHNSNSNKIGNNQTNDKRPTIVGTVSLTSTSSEKSESSSKSSGPPKLG